MARCPHGAQACPSGAGGFEVRWSPDLSLHAQLTFVTLVLQCVFTATEDTECGGCLGFGGRNCAAISHALATSCRGDECIVREFLRVSLCHRDGCSQPFSFRCVCCWIPPQRG